VKLTSGVRLGPYEIVAPIGAGGMGEVYRARDTRLDRIVAIKTLHEADARLKIRFEREAKSISALNHPHICALYDVGPDYIVMEHCEGRTLAQRMVDGPLPIAQVLRYGIQIADALDKAHRQGIIHRDLKPANIVLTKSGVKLLDFGLAKQRVESSPAEATVQRVTEEGKILGTIQYMSPELFHGKEADARSDIFALGLILFEMVTGKPAFSGDSKASLIAAILEHEPVPNSAPPPIDQVIRACLAKDPDERIQSAHDVKLQLKSIGEGPGVVAEIRRARPISMLITLAAIALVVGVVGFIAGHWNRATSRRSIQHYAIPLPANAPIAMGESLVLALSPDGNHLVYIAATEPRQLYLRSSDGFGAKAIPGTENARNPFFSPDGQWIGFEADSFLKKVSLAGGEPVTLCAAHHLRGAAWGSDNQIIFAQNWTSLQRVSASGGKPQPLTRESTKNERWPVILPDGKHVLYTLGDSSGSYDNAKILALSLADGRSQVLLERATDARYIPGGHLVYLHSGTLFSMSFDPVTLKLSGLPTPVVEEVANVRAHGLACAAVSSDGTLVYVPRNPAELQSQLVWVDRKGAATPITSRRGGFSEPQLSPDGKQLLVCVEDKQHRADIWLCELGSDAWTRLTSEGDHFTPRWSPDGKQITFSSNRNGTYDVFLMPSDASAPAQQLTRNHSWTGATSWSPDGQTLLATWQRPVTGFDIMAVPLNDPNRPAALVKSRAEEVDGAFSPDGHWVAFSSNESGNFEIYIQAYPQGGRKWLVSSQGGNVPLWRRDGKEIFYRVVNKLMAAEVQLAPRLAIGKPRILFEGDIEDYDISSDGQRFVMVKNEKSTPATQINAVVGAFDTRTP
jgi:eukaryotic-like serine/threonine-protein kinase